MVYWGISEEKTCKLRPEWEDQKLVIQKGQAYRSHWGETELSEFKWGDKSVRRGYERAKSQYKVKMMMMMMITTAIKFSKEKIQIAIFRCLNCYFMEESNLVLLGSSGNKIISQFSCA